ncbi:MULTISPECIES: hypothetical protein [Burkholderia]|uniref:hypothetical protein n=1 Tax=Burkholderia TaxID=32008 RepID=UPI00050E0619|nr:MULTISPECIES: hypothetical protein [Burkholderia]KGC70209.1 hypothetical protein DP57_5907 [Burkholderia pseudomallei]KWK67581.1 hypothetical protein WT82_18195 [Burkholderia stagnalis]
MRAQLVERWEGGSKHGRYQIEVERFESRPGVPFFNIRKSCGGRAYDTAVARSAAEARQRIQHTVDWGLAVGPTHYKRTYRDAQLAPVDRDPEPVLAAQPNPHEQATKIGLFLVNRTGQCTGKWRGKLLADEQRALLGRYFGRGTLTIDGARERIRYQVEHLFGGAVETKADLAWREL